MLPLAWVGWMSFPQPHYSHGEVRDKSWRVLRLVVPSYMDEMRQLHTFVNLRLNHVSETRLGREGRCIETIGFADGTRSPSLGL